MKFHLSQFVKLQNYVDLIKCECFQYILEDIFWSGTPLLESVGEHEPHVEELRENIKKAIRKALIPMKAYAREYEKYLEIMNLDINVYIK